MFNMHIVHIKGYVFVKLKKKKEKYASKWCTAHDNNVYLNTNPEWPIATDYNNKWSFLFSFYSLNNLIKLNVFKEKVAK